MRVWQRADSSSEWAIWTLRGALAGELSQRVENSVRGEVLMRTDSSSEWAIWTLRHADWGLEETVVF